MFTKWIIMYYLVFKFKSFKQVNYFIKNVFPVNLENQNIKKKKTDDNPFNTAVSTTLSVTQTIYDKFDVWNVSE